MTLRQKRWVLFQQIINFFDTHILQIIDANTAFRQRITFLRQNPVHDNVGSDIPALFIAPSTARNVQERRVQHFVDKDAFLFITGKLPEKIEVEKERTPVRSS